jgi:FkbM family methyltransferase
LKKIIRKDYVYNFARLIIPPIIFLILRKSPLYAYIRKYISKFSQDKHVASWHTISAGELAGYELYVDSHGMFKEMIEGTYDTFFSDYLKKFNLEGKTVIDVGAHIGYDALFFAKAVGKTGKVYAFEPNTINKERLDLIIIRNVDLSEQVKTFTIAISNKKGIEEFIFSSVVDNGTSSGSFIEASSTFWDKNIYERDIGFKRTSVQTIPLNEISDLGITELPALIKIDVEGAEYLVLEGGYELIKKSQAILLIEIHSIFNMLKVSESLKKLNYSMDLLKQESDGRCFISATPDKRN